MSKKNKKSGVTTFPLPDGRLGIKGADGKFAGSLPGATGLPKPEKGELPTLPIPSAETEEAVTVDEAWEKFLKVAEREDLQEATENGGVRELTDEERKQVDLKIHRAIYQLTKEFPYYSKILFAFKRIESPGMGTVGVDKYWRLYYDPQAILEWDEKVVAGALAHEVGHCVRQHLDRWEELKEPAANIDVWNISADAPINDDLKEIERKRGSESKIATDPRWYYRSTFAEKHDIDVSEMETAEDVYFKIKEEVEKRCTCGQQNQQNHQYVKQ